ncbi:hypothetical protein PoB_002211700 [Plakobranchus ocellatus]|uniref:Uncharacterized protein n=1 Tax=Plakobranchus ocellatus TaxID=259542 RepID=A0AAV3ZJZ0_9GAST|nr:hypothetical protein PoB_002211700 [Plakobranchus ocellatus]
MFPKDHEKTEDGMKVKRFKSEHSEISNPGPSGVKHASPSRVWSPSTVRDLKPRSSEVSNQHHSGVMPHAQLLGMGRKEGTAGAIHSAEQKSHTNESPIANRDEHVFIKPQKPPPKRINRKRETTTTTEKSAPCGNRESQKQLDDLIFLKPTKPPPKRRTCKRETTSTEKPALFEKEVSNPSTVRVLKLSPPAVAIPSHSGVLPHAVLDIYRKEDNAVHPAAYLARF